jgi:hypothetical protein
LRFLPVLPGLSSLCFAAPSANAQTELRAIRLALSVANDLRIADGDTGTSTTSTEAEIDARPVTFVVLE